MHENIDPEQDVVQDMNIAFNRFDSGPYYSTIIIVCTTCVSVFSRGQLCFQHAHLRASA